MCDRPMRELSNPGASGSLFYLSADDAFIMKTVQKKEARFLQKLLPGYYLVRLRYPTQLSFSLSFSLPLPSSLSEIILDFFLGQKCFFGNRRRWSPCELFWFVGCM